MSAFSGTARRSGPAECASPRSGPARDGAARSFRASARKSVVEFLEGDPDRPLVIGTVYNDEYKLPYDLPDNKTIAGLKSDSTKGGGGYNEWNFEDKKGSEKIGIHAEKDL